MQSAVEALLTTTTPTCAAAGKMWFRRLEENMPHAVERPATTNTHRFVVLITRSWGGTRRVDSSLSAAEVPVTTTTVTPAVTASLQRSTAKEHAVETEATTLTHKSVVLTTELCQGGLFSSVFLLECFLLNFQLCAVPFTYF